MNYLNAYEIINIQIYAKALHDFLRVNLVKKEKLACNRVLSKKFWALVRITAI